MNVPPARCLDASGIYDDVHWDEEEYVMPV